MAFFAFIIYFGIGSILGQQVMSYLRFSDYEMTEHLSVTDQLLGASLWPLFFVIAVIKEAFNGVY